MKITTRGWEMTRLARAHIKVRRVQRKREQDKLHKLALDRNKALNEAERHAKRAKAEEEKRDAQAKLMKAKGIKPNKHNGLKKPAGQTIRGINKSVAKTMKGVRKFARKYAPD